MNEWSGPPNCGWQFPAERSLPCCCTVARTDVAIFCCSCCYAGPPKINFLGCVTDEGLFQGSTLSPKNYFGDRGPANFKSSIKRALKDDAPYVAMSRTGDFAYGFTFGRLAPSAAPTPRIAACITPCIDVPSRSCGAADGLNGSGAKQRVWAVYQLSA
jgi:hypothetical protein